MNIIIGISILTYWIITTVLASKWLGWRVPFGLLYGWLLIPTALIMFFINKVLHKRIFIGGIEISFE